MNLHKHSTRSLRKPCRYCGKTEGLYWAHDTDTPERFTCRECGVSGVFQLAESVNGDPRVIRLHDCRGKHAGEPDTSTVFTVSEPASDPKPFGFGRVAASAPTTSEPVVGDPEPVRFTPEPASVPSTRPAPTGDRAELLSALLDMLAPKVDESQVRGILRDELASVTRELDDKITAKLADVHVPVQLAVSLNNGDPITITGAHPALDSILRYRVPAMGKGGRPVMLVGPAGSGKTYLVKQVAKALDLPFGYQTLNPAMTVTALLGYVDANGTYHPTPLRKAVEHGGVFLFNEVDNGNPSILTAMNEIVNAEPGEAITFPDGEVIKSDRFVPFADANTYGKGADRLYVGRQPLDGAFLNRWSVVAIDYDPAVEQAICQATGLDGATIDTVLTYVRALRDSIALHKMPVVLSMRDAASACAVLATGLDSATVIETEIRRGLSDSDWNKITATVPTFYL